MNTKWNNDNAINMYTILCICISSRRSETVLFMQSLMVLWSVERNYIILVGGYSIPKNLNPFFGAYWVTWSRKTPFWFVYEWELRASNYITQFIFVSLSLFQPSLYIFWNNIVYFNTNFHKCWLIKMRSFCSNERFRSRWTGLISNTKLKQENEKEWKKI